MVKPAIFILGVSALPLAHTLKTAFGGEIHAPLGMEGADVPYRKATDHLAHLFVAGRAIVGLCASGILVRAVAPHLADKHQEPPVIAVAEDGGSVVPLLGGHHGANDLSRAIASRLQAHAAITTASDIRFGAGLDQPPPGVTLANPIHHKAFAARVLAGESIRIEGEAPWLAGCLTSPEAKLRVVVTEKSTAGSEDCLVYHPRCLAVGVGCERGASAEELIENVEAALADAGLSRQSVALVASIDIKADEPAIHALARHLGVEARFFAAQDLKAAEPLLATPSELVQKEVGVAGVAESAALVACDSHGELLSVKRKSKRTTCAIAGSFTGHAKEVRNALPFAAPLPGRGRGLLHVVGIGPGASDWRAPAACAALTASSDWVGYGLYLDLVADILDGQTEHRFPLGGEEDRVRHAIALAKEGKEVALVCSGDAGIYAMAALVYEIVDLEPCRIAVDVIPGISAFQAAAAKAGAMIGHDFCCISLSDLLTPWGVIENRVKAAAQGDFVVSFYNPRSLKRRSQLERAFTILRQHRPPATPVVIASNLGRPEETVRIVSLQDFDPEEVDMLTLVMVGSSQSKSFARGDGRTYAYTPRGYARKREAAE
ncbi:MAG: precorrin-3B C(17)-methyltransferase [Alphaproteobacteria bacterium]|nr:precorrin-3B C(17)-methyltransferase [Alphaproteobacteria bacterium]